jgi:hypothetical protein
MPCYRCGTRQADPDRGESPWKRGVRDDRQVLICPPCQQSFDWTGDLDRCGVCSSVRLVRRLGEIECKDCGSVRDPVPGPGEIGPAGQAAALGGDPVPAQARGPAAAPGLAEEVQQALDRVLGQARRAAGIS